MTDYIKREDALKVFDTDSMIKAWHKTESIPSADVAPVSHGRWDFDMSGAWCSVCGEYSEGEYRYCPNCGAKMDGEKKNCDTCKHYDKRWDDAICDECTTADSHWERRNDELQEDNGRSQLPCSE